MSNVVNHPGQEDVKRRRYWLLREEDHHHRSDEPKQNEQFVDVPLLENISDDDYGLNKGESCAYSLIYFIQWMRLAIRTLWKSIN